MFPEPPTPRKVCYRIPAPIGAGCKPRLESRIMAVLTWPMTNVVMLGLSGHAKPCTDVLVRPRRPASRPDGGKQGIPNQKGCVKATPRIDVDFHTEGLRQDHTPYRLRSAYCNAVHCNPACIAHRVCTVGMVCGSSARPPRTPRHAPNTRGYNVCGSPPPFVSTPQICAGLLLSRIHTHRCYPVCMGNSFLANARQPHRRMRHVCVALCERLGRTTLS